MKKYWIILAIFSLFSIHSFAQQMPVFSNLHMDPFIVNSAVAGTKEGTVISICARNQFMGFEKNAPKTQLISGHMNYNGYGMGAKLMNDQYGHFRMISASFTYAYIMQVMDNASLSFGLTPRISQFSVDQSDYIYFDELDDAISGAKESVMVFDADFGAMFTGKNYYAGIGINNLLQPKITLGNNDSEENRIVRTYNFLGAYRYNVSDDFGAELFSYVNYSSPLFSFDVSIQGYIMKNYWIGAGYRSGNSIDIKIGGNYKQFSLGYAYEITMGGLSGYSGGTHEILFSIQLGNKNSNSQSRM